MSRHSPEYQRQRYHARRVVVLVAQIKGFEESLSHISDPAQRQALLHQITKAQQQLSTSREAIATGEPVAAQRRQTEAAALYEAESMDRSRITDAEQQMAYQLAEYIREHDATTDATLKLFMVKNGMSNPERFPFIFQFLETNGSIDWDGEYYRPKKAPKFDVAARLKELGK